MPRTRLHALPANLQLQNLNEHAQYASDSPYRLPAGLNCNLGIYLRRVFPHHRPGHRISANTSFDDTSFF